MTIAKIDPNMPVDELMRRCPATIGVMIRYRMLCIGCPIGSFHTVAEAAVAHCVDEAALTAELLATMRGVPSAHGLPVSVALNAATREREEDASCR
jgi:hybrid cluster-associated redox disulfide protein